MCLYVAGDGPDGCHHYPKCPAALTGRVSMVNRMLGTPTPYESGACQNFCRVRIADKLDGRPEQPRFRPIPGQPMRRKRPSSGRKKKKGGGVIDHTVIMVTPYGLVDVGS